MRSIPLGRSPRALLAALCALLWATAARAIDFAAGGHSFSVSGFLQTGNSVRILKPDKFLVSLSEREPNRLLLQQNALRLSLDGIHPRDIRSFLTVDLLYSSEPPRPFDERAEAEINEAYVDFTARSISWRVGKEKVIWGTSDLISPFDILTARDVKDPFVVPTLQDRIGQWGVHGSGRWRDYAVEGVYTPVWTRSRTPDAVTRIAEDRTILETRVDEWFPPIGILPTIPFIETGDPQYPYFNFVTIYHRAENPDNDLGTGALGIKLNWIKGNYDTDLYFVTAMDPLPHPEISALFADIGGGTLQLQIEGQQKFSRLNVFGGATSTTWGRLALREELAFTQGSFWYRLFDEEQLLALFNEFEQTGFAELRDTQAERWKVQNIVGGDYEIPSLRLFTSTQLSLSHGFGHKEVYFSKANEVSMSNVVRRTFRDDHLSLSFTDLINFSGGSVWMRPAVSFTPATFEDLQLSAGINIFAGKDFSYVGQYGHHSNFTFTARLLY